MLQNITFCCFQTDNNANIGPLKPLLSVQNQAFTRYLL